MSPDVSSAPSLLTESTYFSGGEWPPDPVLNSARFGYRVSLGGRLQTLPESAKTRGEKALLLPPGVGPAPSLRAWFPAGAGERQVREPEGRPRAVWVGASAGERQQGTSAGAVFFSEMIGIRKLIAISGPAWVSDSALVAEPAGKPLLACSLQLLFLGQTRPVRN